MAVFHPTVALDSITGELVVAGAGTIHATTDVTGVTPLPVTDMSGVSWSGDQVPVHGGLVAAFDTGEEGPTRVLWISGGHVITLWSPEAMEVAAATSAAAASTAAVDAVTGALVEIESATTGFLTQAGYAPMLVVESVEDIPAGVGHPTVVVIPGEVYEPVVPPVPPPYRRGWAQHSVGGTSATVLSAVTAGAQPGDALVVAIVTGVSGATYTPPVGWTELLAPTTMGTRTLQIFAGAHTDPETTNYEFPAGQSAVRRAVLVAVGGAAGVGDWVVGTLGLRNVTGTSVTNLAPSVTTVVDASLVLTVSAEATSAADTIAPEVTDGGADGWFWTGEGADPSVAIETVLAATRVMALAGVAAPVTVTYQNTQTNNGSAIQVVIPPVPEGP
jgi:hypothetical protein